MSLHRLSRTDARRIAVRAQLLTKPRPKDLFEVVRHLTVLQLDPTAAVAPSAELVLWSRLGPAYSRGELAEALEGQRLIDLHGFARPAEDLALFRAAMERWPGREPLKDWQQDIRDWLRANDASRRDILAVLRSDGPLPASQLPDDCVAPWRSSGWNNNRNRRMLLQTMVSRGEVAAAGREGREQLWDLAERIYPDDPVVPGDEAIRIRNARRLRALGLARARAPVTPNEPNDVGEAGESAVVDGLQGAWRVDPAYLGGRFTGRAALLSPLDRLLIDRKRLAEIFDWDYQLEMYKPTVQRQWGYWAMPILYGDRFVGKLDAASDREAGVFRVNAVHRDTDWSTAMTAAIDGEIADLARWLDLELERA